MKDPLLNNLISTLLLVLAVLGYISYLVVGIFIIVLISGLGASDSGNAASFWGSTIILSIIWLLCSTPIAIYLYGSVYIHLKKYYIVSIFMNLVIIIPSALILLGIIGMRILNSISTNNLEF